ncbi:MAG: response regulator transcription factor [Eubacteriales bacterium]|nr:response regulator transcription factor [Eubacteriales bacterium]
MEKQKILIVDDDKNICQVIKLYLENEGYATATAYNGKEGLEVFESSKFSLIILDIMMPVMDGRDMCREIRKQSDVPIIMLSAKGETFDKVLGLELGADDYMVKPFEPSELLARVKSILRRTEKQPEEADELVFNNLRISIKNYTVEYRGEYMELPPKELELLYYLASHKNMVFTREQLLEKVWGFDFYGDSRTVDVHISRLREKLQDETWALKTVWGVGYKFEVTKK